MVNKTSSATKAAICILCKKEHSTKAIEHIVPEAIGCPTEFVLQNGEVCENCNNRLGFLDREVASPFDVLAFHAGVPRKDNKLPVVLGRGNFVGQHTNEGKTIFINMDPKSISAEHGVRLGAYGKSQRNIKADLKVNGNVAQVTFDLEFRFSKRFVRGLYKIALEALTYFTGTSEALNTRYDSIREYITKGTPERKALAAFTGDTSYAHRILPPFRLGERGHRIFLRLAVVEFVVDLTPDISTYEAVLEKINEDGRTKIIFLPTEI